MRISHLPPNVDFDSIFVVMTLSQIDLHFLTAAKRFGFVDRDLLSRRLRKRVIEIPISSNSEVRRFRILVVLDAIVVHLFWL